MERKKGEGGEAARPYVGILKAQPFSFSEAIPNVLSHDLPGITSKEWLLLVERPTAPSRLSASAARPILSDRARRAGVRAGFGPVGPPFRARMFTESIDILRPVRVATGAEFVRGPGSGAWPRPWPSSTRCISGRPSHRTARTARTGPDDATGCCPRAADVPHERRPHERSPPAPPGHPGHRAAAGGHPEIAGAPPAPTRTNKLPQLVRHQPPNNPCRIQRPAQLREMTPQTSFHLVSPRWHMKVAGDGGGGEEVLGLAFVAAVKASAPGQPGAVAGWWGHITASVWSGPAVMRRVRTRTGSSWSR